MTRHSWPNSHMKRFPHKTERDCAKGCGIVKVTRHEGREHWQEFWRDEVKIECEGTPVCEPVRVEA